MKIKPIAIHLPQFHPIPENDKWWGKGFTEWTNVVRAQPRFNKHYQPHLPADLGFYDLRLEESRLAQEELAKKYGVYGFCYYHYWFNGKRVLNAPVDRKLKNPNEDLPFMLCWANENWARTWDGADDNILLEQNYNFQDDLDHIRFLIPIFKDERYIRVDDKPMIVIYKSDELPDVRKTIEIWRKEAHKEGLDLYICRMNRWNTNNDDKVLDLGFDAVIDFQPLSQSFQNYLEVNNTIVKKIKNKVFKKLQLKNKPSRISYKDYVDYDIAHPLKNEKMYPGVCPSWDNSARKKANGMVFHDSTPEYFYKWVTHKLRSFKPFSKEENFLFINAWNEWAEGNHLEPDQKWGNKYLKALHKATNNG